jgi:hypothetical protein
MSKGRWAVVIVAACLVVAVAAVAYAAAKASARTNELTAEVMSAKQFRLVDSRGQVRAALGFIPAPDGPPALVLYDGHKAQRATVALDAGGSPSLILGDAKKHARAALSVMEDGSASLMLRGDGKQPRAMLMLMPNGKASLTLFDERGKATWSTR